MVIGHFNSIGRKVVYLFEENQYRKFLFRISKTKFEKIVTLLKVEN